MEQPALVHKALSVLVLGPRDNRSRSITRYASDLAISLDALETLRVSRALAPPPEPSDQQGRDAPLARSLWSRSFRNIGRYAVTIVRPWLPRPRRLRGAADIFHAAFEYDAYLLSALPREQTIVTCHDLFQFSREHEELLEDGKRLSSLVRFLRRRQLRHALAQVGHIACISEQTRREVLEHIPIDPRRVSVVPNGLAAHFQVLTPEVVDQTRATLPQADHRIIQVSSGGHPRKNVPGTLRVLHQLVERGLDVQLLNVGGQLTGVNSELAAELGIESRIVECGAVDDKGLVRLYNAADVLLFPSFYEGFGWPPLEAMACGTPVVVSDAPVFKEILGDDTCSAAPNDIDALTTQVESILTDRDLATVLTQRGLERAASYRWERAAECFASIYRKMLAVEAAGVSSADEPLKQAEGSRD